MVQLNSHVMIGGGLAWILQVNLATEPSSTTEETGWTSKGEIPKDKKFMVRKWTTLENESE